MAWKWTQNRFHGTLEDQRGADVGEPGGGHGRELDEGVEVDAAQTERVPADAGRRQAGEARTRRRAPRKAAPATPAADVGDVEAEQAGAPGSSSRSLRRNTPVTVAPATAKRQLEALAPLAGGELGERLVPARQREARRGTAAASDHAAGERHLRAHLVVGVAEAQRQSERSVAGRAASRGGRAARRASRNAARRRAPRRRSMPGRPMRHSFSSMPAPPTRVRRPGAAAPAGRDRQARVAVRRYRRLARRPAARPVDDDASRPARTAASHTNSARTSRASKPCRLSSMPSPGRCGIEVDDAVRARPRARGDRGPVRGRERRHRRQALRRQTAVRQQALPDRQQAGFGVPPPASGHGGVDADE